MKITMSGDDVYFVENHEKLLEWVRAHGLDPNDIPVPFNVEIGLGKVTFERFVRGDDGKYIIDEENNTAVKETVTVRKVAPWPLGRKP